MPLDPEVRVLLDSLAQMGSVPIEDGTPEEARSAFEQLSVLTAASKQSVHSVRDITIPGPYGEIPARLYLPSDAVGLPLVMFFHGGGFVIGSIDSYDEAVRALVNASGCAILSVGYRLAPEYKFPHAPNECYVATVWAHENAESFGCDPTKMALAGDSAGGNLAAVVALMARDSGLGEDIKFQLLIYPATDNDLTAGSVEENAEGYFLTKAAMEWFSQHYYRDESDLDDPLAAPIKARDLSGLPPTLILTAEFDPIRDWGEAYATQLSSFGTPAELIRLDGLIHGFFNLGPFVKRAKETIELAGKKLSEALV